MNRKKFEKQIGYNLENIKSIDEFNETQKYLRNILIYIFSNGDEVKLKELQKKYDLDYTKKLFYRFLEPIDLTFLDKVKICFKSFFLKFHKD